MGVANPENQRKINQSGQYPKPQTNKTVQEKMCQCIGNCSCNAITLPSVAGPQGPQGPAGSNGTNGTNGVAIIQTLLDRPVQTVGSTYEVLGFLTIDPTTIGFANGDGILVKGFINTNNYSPPLGYPLTSMQLIMTSTLPVIGTASTGTVIFTYEDLFNEEDTFAFDVDVFRFSNNSINAFGDCSQYSNLQVTPQNITNKSIIVPRKVCIWNPVISPSMTTTFYIAIQGKVDAGTVELQSLLLNSEFKKHI